MVDAYYHYANSNLKTLHLRLCGRVEAEGQLLALALRSTSNLN